MSDIVYRFKTEAEFIEQYGGHWRDVHRQNPQNNHKPGSSDYKYHFAKGMDPLFGIEITKSEYNKLQKTNSEKMYLPAPQENISWSISKHMVIAETTRPVKPVKKASSKELSKTRKFLEKIINTTDTPDKQDQNQTT